MNTEIEAGSLVMLKEKIEAGPANNLLQGWISAYGRGPFRVVQRPDPKHVALESWSSGECHIIHFGSTGYAQIHIDYVELCQS